MLHKQAIRHMVPAALVVIALLFLFLLAACEMPAPQPPEGTATLISVVSTATAIPQTVTSAATEIAAPPTNTPTTSAPEVTSTVAPTEVVAATATSSSTTVPPLTETPVPSGTPVGTPDPALLQNRLWILVSYGNAQSPTYALPNPTVSAVFTGAARVTGSAGCNGYFASYTLDGSAITVDTIGRTLMACADTIMRQETAYLNALQAAQTWQVNADELEITCGGTQPGVLTFRASEVSSAQGLTLEQLRNATYASDFVASGQVTLKDGQSHEPQVSSAEVVTVLIDAALGDLNGDGIADGAVVLATNGGGSGTFYQLVAMLDQDGQPVEAANTLLGDRIKLEDLSIDSGVIAVDMITQGPGDPFCCPTLRLTVEYQLQDGQLAELQSRSPEAAGGPPLEGTNWALTGYGDPASLTALVDATESTIMFQDGQVSGGATCNRFFGSYVMYGSAINLAGFGTTRMSCDAAMMAQETAILALLGKVETYAIQDGKLTLNTADGQVLVYQTAEASAADVKITSPQEGAEVSVSKPILVEGTGQALFENNVVVRIIDGGGNVLVQQSTIMTTAEVGGAGTWSIELTVTVAAGTQGSIIAFADSPRDGSVVAYDEVAVTFEK